MWVSKLALNKISKIEFSETIYSIVERLLIKHNFIQQERPFTKQDGRKQCYMGKTSRKLNIGMNAYGGHHIQ